MSAKKKEAEPHGFERMAEEGESRRGRAKRERLRKAGQLTFEDLLGAAPAAATSHKKP